jgi:hypothetical protein
MTKLCPVMSAPTPVMNGAYAMLHEVVCKESYCMAYIPPTNHYFACTLELTVENYSKLCKLERYIEDPDAPQEMTCDGCEYYKKIQCTPIPARCKLMEENK